MAGHWSYRVKDAYARGARAAGRALTGLGVLPRTPPDRRQRFRHWLVSLTRVHDSLAIAELDVPWWTYAAIDSVDAWLEARPRPIRVFEFGSGASTLWLARRVDEVHTVEHHAGFAARMRPEFAAHPHVTLHQVEARWSTRPGVPSGKAGHEGLDFADYVAAIDRVGGRFDLIVIDGRARDGVPPGGDPAPRGRRPHRLRQLGPAPVPARDRGVGAGRAALRRPDADPALPGADLAAGACRAARALTARRSEPAPANLATGV